jgi:hypothetical protein
LSIWTNNIVQKIGSHYTLSTISHIIGPNRQGWDRSGIRVYNQAFLIPKIIIFLFKETKSGCYKEHIT